MYIIEIITLFTTLKKTDATFHPYSKTEVRKNFYTSNCYTSYIKLISLFHQVHFDSVSCVIKSATCK